MTTYREEYDRIVKIHELHPTFVEWDHVRNDLLPAVALSTVIITMVFILSIHTMRHLAPKSEDKVIFKSAYQITNCVVNGVLGVLGLYYFNHVLESNPTIETQVLGHREVYPLACIQFGYNLWALPVGLTIVKESPAMLLHHLAVLLVTTMSSLVTTGHTWYAPLMYGILELSSVPLSIMNAFKDNPQYIEKYPAAYNIIRIIFAFSFLYIRWYLFLPMKYKFLRSFAVIVMTHPSTFFFVFTGFSWLAALFLCLLQLMWGFVIVKGLVKFVFGGRQSASKKDN
jgi:hypothetical protein